MKEIERFEALLKREKPDRVPIWPFGSAGGLSAIHCGKSIAEEYTNPETALNVLRKTAQDFGWLFIPFYGYASYGAWEFGGDIKWPSSEFNQAPSITRHPVVTEEDAWKLKMPDIPQAGIIPLQAEFNRLSAEKRLDDEPFKVMAFIGGPFTTAANICSVEKMSRWLIKKPEVAHHLVQLVTEHLIGLTEYWQSLYGTERVLIFTAEATAANNIISPKQFEQFVLPYLKELHQKILSLGFRHILCHICGEHNGNMPYWAQIPMGDPGIVSIPHEVSLSKASGYFPNDIIMGNLAPPIIMSQTEEDVYQATRVVLEEGMKIAGGYLFSTGCGIPPMSPAANIRAMNKAVNDFGWYK